MIEPAARTLTSVRLSINWWDWGGAGRPLMILVHGGRDHGRSWDDVARAFADEWRVAAIDLRGHGRSDWADGGGYGLDHFVYDLDRLANEIDVTADNPATLVSHSLGGNIALRWAGLNPDRVARVVAIEGLGPTPAKQAEIEARGIAARMNDWIERLAKLEGRTPKYYPDMATAIARLREAHPRFSAELAEHLTRHGTVTEAGGVRFAHDPTLMGWPVVDISYAEKNDLWRAIACPVLLCWGRESWDTNPAEDGRAAIFRDARTAAFDAGHWVHHDLRDAFVAEVKAFLDG